MIWSRAFCPTAFVAVGAGRQGLSRFYLTSLAFGDPRSTAPRFPVSVELEGQTLPVVDSQPGLRQ